VQTLRLPVHQPGVPYIEARHRWYEGLSHYYRNLAASGD
jgi:hypothetical protein